MPDYGVRLGELRKGMAERSATLREQGENRAIDLGISNKFFRPTADDQIIDGDTIGKNRIMGFDTPESAQSVNNLKAQQLAENGVSLTDQKRLGLAGKHELVNYMKAHPNMIFSKSAGKDAYGRSLINDDALTEHMISSGTAVPTDRYDQKLQSVFRATQEKLRRFNPHDTDMMEEIRQRNIDRQKPGILESFKNMPSALGAGTQRLVAGIGDFVLDAVTTKNMPKGFIGNDGTGNSTWLDHASSAESANANFGYDDKEAKFRQAEAVSNFHQGRYGQVASDVLHVVPEMLAESIPTIASYFVPFMGEAKAGMLLGKLGTVANLEKGSAASKVLTKVGQSINANTGFGLAVGSQTNQDIDEFTKNNNGVAPSANRIAMMTANNFVQMGVDKFAAKDLLSGTGVVNTTVDALKEAVKILPNSAITSIAKQVVKTALVMGEEGGQEYYQQWAQILNQKLGTTKYGSLENLMRNKEVTDEALGAGLMGAGMGVGMHGVGTVKNAVLPSGDKKQPTVNPNFTSKTVPEAIKPSQSNADHVAEIKSQFTKIGSAVMSKSTSILEGFKAFEDLALNTQDPAMLKNIDQAKRMLATRLTKEEIDANNLTLGSHDEAVDTIQEILAHAPKDGSDVMEKNIATIASKYSVKPEELQQLKDAAAVELEATVENRGYKTYGAQLRRLLQNPETNSEKIQEVKDRMAAFKGSTEQSYDAIQAIITQAEGDYKSGVFTGDQKQYMSKDYTTLTGKPLTIKKSDIQKALEKNDRSGDIYQILDAKKRTLTGIDQEAARSNMSLDTGHSFKIPTHSSAKIEASRQADRKAYRAVNKMIGVGKVGTKVGEYLKANKALFSSEIFTSEDTVGVVLNPRKDKNAAAWKNAFNSEKNPLHSVKLKVDAAIKAGATIVTPKISIRNSDQHKSSDGMLAHYLAMKGNDYVEVNDKNEITVGSGRWVLKNKATSKSALKDKVAGIKKSAVEMSIEKAKEYIAKMTAEGNTKAVKTASANLAKLEARLKPVESTKIPVEDMIVKKTEESTAEIKSEAVDVPMNDVLSTSQSTGKADVNYKTKNVKKSQVIDINKIVKLKRDSVNKLASMSVKDIGSATMELAKHAVEMIQKQILPMQTKTVSDKTDKLLEDFKNKDSLGRGLIYNKEGQINTNVATAIALAVEEYKAFSAGDFYPKTREDIAKLLQLPSVNDVTYEMVKTFKDKGVPLKLIANSIGKAVISNLDLSAQKDMIDDALYAKLIADLGMHGVLMLKAEGAVIFDSIPMLTYNKMLANKIEVHDENAKFVFVQKTEKFDVEKSRETFDAVQTEVGNESTIRREPHTKDDIPVKTAENTKARKNDITGIPARALRVLNKLTKMKHVKVESGITWLKENKNTAMDLLGYTYESETTSTNKQTLSTMSARARESAEAKNREIEKSYEELINLEGDALFFDWFFTKNGRYMMDSNTVNPQTDKLHRFLVIPATQLVKLSKDNVKHMDAFKLAIAQAVGMGTDKKSTPAIMRKADDMIAIGSTGLTKALEDAEYRHEHGIEIEHLGHYLQAIEALKAYETSENTFETNISAEFDAVTSGFGIKLMQMPIIKNLYGENGWLRKVGVFTDTDNVMSMNDELSTNNLVDSYQTLAQGITRDAVEPVNDSRNIWKDLKKALPQVVDGAVTKELRTLFKDPFMTFNYAAGMASIKKSLSYNIVNNIIDEIAGGNSSYDKVLLDRIFKMVEHHDQKNLVDLLRNVDIDDIKMTKAPHTEKGKYTPKTLGEYLTTVISETYGAQVETSLKSHFGEFLRANNSINNAFRFMFHAYKTMYDKKLAELQKDGTVTIKQKMDVIHSLKDVFPLIKGPSNDNISNGVVIVDSKVSQAEALHGAAQTHAIDQSHTVQGMVREFEAAMSAGAVVPIHFIDGAAMGALIESSTGGQAIHDAWIPNLIDAMSDVQSYNQNWYEQNKGYSLIDDILESLYRVKEHMDATTPPLEVKLLEGENNIELESNYKVSIDDMLHIITDLANTVNKGRAELYAKDMSVVHMAALHDSKFSITSPGEFKTKQWSKPEVEFKPERVKDKKEGKESSEPTEGIITSKDSTDASSELEDLLASDNGKAILDILLDESKECL